MYSNVIKNLKQVIALGYCNLADEDFVDENVKYIREGFEKRVSSIFFLSK